MNNLKLSDVGDVNITTAIKNESTEKECGSITKITEWKRICPKCSRLIYYFNKYTLKYASENQSKCELCRSIGKTDSTNTEFSNKCPSCGDLIFYSTKYSLKTAIQNRSLCRSCCRSGMKHPNFGRIQTKIEKETRNNKLRGKIRTVESRQKYAESKRGNKNPRFGIHEPKSIEHKRKIRLSCIKSIQERLSNVNQTMRPAFSIRACKFIDEYGKQNGYTFQHALNGGEHHIEKLGYWIDGYDKEKNVVIEYNENNHWHRNNKQKDEQRRIEIIDFLRCKFILVEEKVGEQHGISEYFCK